MQLQAIALTGGSMPPAATAAMNAGSVSFFHFGSVSFFLFFGQRSAASFSYISVSSLRTSERDIVSSTLQVRTKDLRQNSTATEILL